MKVSQKLIWVYQHTCEAIGELTVSCSAKSISSMMFSLEHSCSTDGLISVTVSGAVLVPSIHRQSEGSGDTTVLTGNRFNSSEK